MIPWNEFEYHESEKAKIEGFFFSEEKKISLPAHMLQTLNFFDSRDRMQKLDSHGPISRSSVEEEEIATRA